MKILEQIKENLKDAMRAKDEAKVLVFRSIISACTNHLVATNRKPQDELPEEEVIDVIRKLAKQRKDSIEQFEKGGREDLVNKEKVELVILEEFLPKLMSDDEIKAFVETKKAELGVTDKSKMGILVGALMKDLKGRADGADVKRVVEGIF